MTESLNQRIAAGRRALVDAGLSPGDAALDAEVLARHVLGWDLARLLVRNHEPASDEFTARFSHLITRRRRHEPIALITGHREFWGLDFLVTPATLIPRPETELIVDEALRWLRPDAPSTVLDIGTGTGCLAVAIAHERPATSVVATDISHQALLVARQNARAHGVDDRVRFVRTDLANGIGLTADLIVSNPPYVPERAAAALPAGIVEYEPPAALFGGPDGLTVSRRLFGAIHSRLAAGGVLIVEFGYGQEGGVREAAEAAEWRIERVLQDLQGIARTIVLRR